ncbi:DNA-binding response regulator [bacterium endosymbiont of Escarpia laminata]|nr:MAG: DNA-binding response regulator [bacterium endosymbiont of Escarpia laminata]RLJ21380.1 MAG: DNA-binding response regulator [bacterium endosymbiont of Escarpia laminata]
MTRLLLVEDDELLGDGICKVLSRRGDQLEWVRDGRSALTAISEREPDLVLLDINLPDISGFDILKAIRAAENDVPILVLTARSSVSNRVFALDNGADDYLVKPFDIEELCARVRALRRRSASQNEGRLRCGELVMDTSALTLSLAGEPVNLSVREFTLLRTLMESRGRVMSRHQLEEELYGWDVEVASNTIEVHIHNLRKKLTSCIIRTVRGVGYIIEK